MDTTQSIDNIQKEARALRLNLLLDVVTLLPVVAIALLSNSMMLFTDIFDYGKSLLTTFLSWQIARKLTRGETGFYDFGLGKLEVLGGLITSLFIVLALFLTAVATAHRLVNPLPLDPSFALVGIGIHIAGLALNCWLWQRNHRLSLNDSSPLMNAQWRANRADAFGNAGTILALALILLFQAERWSVYIDPVCALIFLILPAFSFFGLIQQYVDDLLDKTIEEDLQLKITKRLAEYYDGYEAFFGVHTRRAGRKVFIDILLGFHPDKMMGEVIDTCERLSHDVEADIAGSSVQVVLQTGRRDELPKSLRSDYQILPLSSTTLPQALKLIQETFALSPEELPREELEESIDRGKHTASLGKIGISDPCYWVVYHKGEVEGLGGYYYKSEDRHEAIWGGWSVYSQKSRTSLSRMKMALLKKLVIEASGTHKKYLRLYTSTDPVEAQANHLYDRLGLKVYYTEPTKDGQHLLLYRQAELSALYEILAEGKRTAKPAASENAL